MFYKFDESPIIACSSGSSQNVAISLIRISGLEPDNYGPIEPLLKFQNQELKLDKLTPRKSYLTKIMNKNEVLDEALLTVFPAPHSYTGETVLEFAVHGNRLNVERIIDLFCLKAKLRRAYGGEFTHRALKNQKLNFSQVEGLDLFLNANNIFSLKQGFSLLSGDIQNDFLELHKLYLNHRSSLEMNIDFLEDIGEIAAKSIFQDTFNELNTQIKSLYKRTQNNIDISQAQIALFGPPNAGKSTFFNKILGSNRSIVSDEKGTTRDYISETVKIGDEYFQLVDTAGIRNSDNDIESQGIERSRSFLKTAFFKILLINPLEDNTDFLKEFDDKSFDVLLLTHSDRNEYPEAKTQVLASHGAVANWSYGTSLIQNDDNFSEIFSKINGKYLKLLEKEPLSLQRHKQVIEEIFNQTQHYAEILEAENDVAIISSELFILGSKIEELLGVISADEVLGNIFDNFCIGK